MSTTADKLALRSIRVTGFMDTIQLQTVKPGTPTDRYRLCQYRHRCGDNR